MTSVLGVGGRNKVLPESKYQAGSTGDSGADAGDDVHIERPPEILVPGRRPSDGAANAPASAMGSGPPSTSTPLPSLGSAPSKSPRTSPRKSPRVLSARGEQSRRSRSGSESENRESRRSRSGSVAAVFDSSVLRNILGNTFEGASMFDQQDRQKVFGYPVPRNYSEMQQLDTRRRALLNDARSLSILAVHQLDPLHPREAAIADNRWRRADGVSVGQDVPDCATTLATALDHMAGPGHLRNVRRTHKPWLHPAPRS